MKKRRKRSSVPSMLFWSRKDQVRFIEAVERFCSLVNDLTIVADRLDRRSQAAKKANETRQATKNGSGPVVLPPVGTKEGGE